MKQTRILKTFTAFVFTIFFGLNTSCQNNSEKVYLIIRGDDMGFSHAANLACIESYEKGIMRSVELMPVTPWLMEAVDMLKEHSGLDVGIHLALTSEWQNLKWRPLTYAPSLVDSNGYFFPMVWPNKNLPPNTSISSSDWKIEDIEKELRAQIELSLAHVPQISHITGHMGFSSLNPKIQTLVQDLAKEYQLEVDLEKYNVQRMRGWDRETAYEDRIDSFCENLKALKPGYYLFVDHPAYDVPEMKGVSHVGYETVSTDREWVTRVFTSQKVKDTIEELGIELISYKDLAE